MCVSEAQLREATGLERIRREWGAERQTEAELAAHLDEYGIGEDPEGGWWWEPPRGDSDRWCLGPDLARFLGLEAAGARGSSRGVASSSSSRGPSAWARAHGASSRPARVAGATRIGDLYMDAAQVRAELDRVDARWTTLKRDVVNAIPLEPPGERATFRRNFVDAFNRWRTFYEDAYDDALAWGSNVTQAEAFDAELETWRARFVELGETPSNPTSSTTADDAAARRAAGAFGGIGDAIRWIAIAAIVVGIAWALSSASSMAPRLIAGGTVAP